MFRRLLSAWVTLPELNRALTGVVGELEAHGFWTRKVSRFQVFLTSCGLDHFGLCYPEKEIHIPAVSLQKLIEWWGNTSATGLKDILRHEYAHALHFSHSRIVMGAAFKEVFPQSARACGFKNTVFVSEYAASEPREDVAETFMYYLKHKGRMPRRFQTRQIRRKWRFIENLPKQLSMHL